MLKKSAVEVLVGLFMLVGIVALVILAFKVSGLTDFGSRHYYEVTAEFDNIGDLKVRAPVSIGGVNIGQVGAIALNKDTFRAHVTLDIDNKFKDIPVDSSASIFTQGLLGSNYISLTPGFDNQVLKNGDEIQTTRSAIILENLIGQFLLSLKGDKGDNSKQGQEQQQK